MVRKTPEIIRRRRALLDLIELADYLAERSGLETARRFLRAAEKTTGLIARMPGIGKSWESTHPRLADLRFFPVARFPNHIIYYRQTNVGIELVRVLHGARDIGTLLESEEESRGDATT